MTTPCSLISSLFVATFSMMAFEANAAIIITNNSGVFNAIVDSMNGQTLAEDFQGYSGWYASGLTGGTGDSAWTAEAPNGLYAQGGVLSTNSPNVALTLTFASGNVFAIGGDFFNTDVDFGRAGGFVRISAGGVSYIYSSSSDSAFAGFVSTSDAIHSITFLPFGPNSANTYASSSAVMLGVVPSPAVLALGALAGMITRRRRH
ncbi:MAG: hypothetical protein EXS01_03655 [Phycisphaerales bacterium]|nr:hypothetical protein [Phycisphaerales bacterium]